MNKYLGQEGRRTLMNYLRPSSYRTHPELKVEGIPTKRWKMLMTMRDLRLWIIENAPFSSRTQLYRAELFQLNNEINFLQTRAMILPFLLWVGASIFFVFWGPRHWRGGIGQYGRPNISQESGGMSVMHDGGIPKLSPNDISDIMGI